MARKAMIEKQKRRERCVAKYREKRTALLKTVKSFKTSEEEKERAREELNRLPRDSSPVRLRNRCKLTGRSRGFLRRFQVSRICLRELASGGFIPGMIKASW
ncbi:30S ribosomal protein S14 [Candidatus Similichlamydia laticola]|uniref:Small ribosomal subunit protein uS14 n=1 Tax=Candidatus Similichlamydia laticola TaxID=2170265 RepID=A0A369KDB9_9BACT|nr:30S ribosomal protein S14 [Candidatus Similichlamydia laticola]RDB31602.1 SSU ribosomal protein S14p [Candidatus Similichlamydia laticola]